LKFRNLRAFLFNSPVPSTLLERSAENDLKRLPPSIFPQIISQLKTWKTAYTLSLHRPYIVIDTEEELFYAYLISGRAIVIKLFPLKGGE
jgi:hypothetical protein